MHLQLNMILCGHTQQLLQGRITAGFVLHKNHEKLHKQQWLYNIEATELQDSCHRHLQSIAAEDVDQ